MTWREVADKISSSWGYKDGALVFPGVSLRDAPPVDASLNKFVSQTIKDLVSRRPRDRRSPHKGKVAWAARMALGYYNQLKFECKRQGVPTYGLSEEIRQHCAETVAAFVEGVTAAEVRDDMTRSRRHRQFSGVVIVTLKKSFAKSTP